MWYECTFEEELCFDTTRRIIMDPRITVCYGMYLYLLILHILYFKIIYQGSASFHTLFWFNKENIPELIQYDCKSDENRRFCKGITLLILSKIHSKLMILFKIQSRQKWRFSVREKRTVENFHTCHFRSWNQQFAYFLCQSKKWRFFIREKRIVENFHTCHFRS